MGGIVVGTPKWVSQEIVHRTNPELAVLQQLFDPQPHRLGGLLRALAEPQ
jgi:hypothetical protein